MRLLLVDDNEGNLKEWTKFFENKQLGKLING